MPSGRQTRHREPINYSEKALEAQDSVPAWVKELAVPSSQQENRGGKENERDPKGSEPNKKSTKAAGEKGGAGKKASKSAPQRGRDKGVTVEPIIDLKQHKNGAKAKRPEGEKLPPALPAADAAGSSQQHGQQLVTKDVPGLPGVKQKRLEPRAAAAAAAPPAPQPSEQAARSAAARKQGNSGGNQKRAVTAEAGQQQEAPPRQPGSKRLKTTVDGSKSAAADAAAAAVVPELGIRQEQQQQGMVALGPGPGAAAAPAAVPRHRRPSAPPALAQPGDDNPRAAAPRAVGASADATEAAAAQSGCKQCQQLSDNFAKLLGEYQALQLEYEALKDARLHEDVAELLKEHDKKVVEHGAKATELVAMWQQQAEDWQQAAEGAEALQRRNQVLERELCLAQEALLERQAVLQRQEAALLELRGRNQLLERRVNMPEVAHKDVQIDGPEAHSAGVQAPSALPPLLQPSGLQMCEARAMAPEGVDLQGTVYKAARPAAASPLGGAAATDPTYTMPGTTYALPLAARLAAAGEQAEGTVQQQAQQPEGMVTDAVDGDGGLQQPQQQPTGGSDMQLTGEGPLVAEQQQLQPVSGRLAHAAAHPRGRVSPAPAPWHASLAPSPLASQLQQGQAQQQQQAEQQQQHAPGSAQRPGSELATAESLTHGVQQLALPWPAAQARARRASAPPAPGIAGSFTAGVAPLERQLLFGSASLGAAHHLLAAVAEEEDAVMEEEGGEGQAQTEGRAPAGSVPPPPREGAVTMIGFQATPCKGGKYIYTDPPSGFVFELGPASPGTPDSSDDEDVGAEELSYRPLQLGSVGPSLPAFLHRAITFEPRYTHKLMAILLGALAEAGPQPSGQ